MQLFHFAVAMVRHPIVLIPPALVVAILYGAGKALGLPRLFWNERPSYRFSAGIAVTLLAAQAFLVAYLLDSLDLPSRSTSFVTFLLIGTVVWLLLIGYRSIVQQLRYRRGKSQDGSITAAPGVAPAIRTVAGDQLSAGAAPQVPAGELMAGVVVGIVVAFLLVFAAQSALVRPVAEAFASSVAELVRPVSEPWLHLLALICLALLLVAFVLLKDRASPGVGLCMLLTLGLACYTAVEFWARNAGFGLLVLLLLLWWAGGLRYKLRISSLSELYRDPTSYPPAGTPDQRSIARPLDFDVALKAADGKAGGRRLILVCASGGGIRAASWTAAILGQLDEIEGFRAATRLITGASGGMMGAAGWLALTAKRNEGANTPAPAGTWQSLMTAVAKDSLMPVVTKLVFHDIPLAFIARNNLQDRAMALEDAWCQNLTKLGIDLRISLGDLRHGEESGQWPSLVLSPMMIEDGRRLIISNLDLSAMNDHRVRWLSSKETKEEPITGLASRAAYQLWQLCPKTWTQLPLSTAARLSAAFPYVSCAVLLPTEPRRHVVDAGYFDNYGLELAGNWLRELYEQRQSLLENISGILVIQIRDNVSQLSVNPESNAQKQLTPQVRNGSRLLRALEGLSSPPVGLLTARDSVMLFRNDSLLESLCHLYSGKFGEDFLTTTIFEFGGEASLSWHLAPEEVNLLAAQATSPGIQLKLKAIDSWLKRRGYWELPRRPHLSGPSRSVETSSS